jgi:integrase
MKSIYVYQDGRDFRFSAKTRRWKKAEDLKVEIEDFFDPVKSKLRKIEEAQQANRVTVTEAIETYITDAATRNLSPATQKKYKVLFRKRMPNWAAQHGIHFLDDWTTVRLTHWRASWSSLGPLTTLKTQERVKTFFAFCVRQGWLAKNPALLLSRITVKQKPTGYFTPDQFEKLLTATSLFGRGSLDGKAEIWSERMRVMLLLMRWSGLRIGDAVTFERSRLMGDNIFLYQAKTGTPVYVPLPPNVAESLRNVPPGKKPNPRYFFWNGINKVAALEVWARSFRRLFELADLRDDDGTPKRCHPHMLRDTFAVENLLAGIPIDQVSILLGHSSVKITEKHYAPFVHARQQQIISAVSGAWVRQKASGAAMGGSPLA